MRGRRNIYYWKSDRAFTAENTRKTADPFLDKIIEQVSYYLRDQFKRGLLGVEPAGGQGNHITLIAKYREGDYFIRLENGPEKDNYMAVESHVMAMVSDLGIPCPKIYLTDVSRSTVPFAIQVMELVEYTDLNKCAKAGRLDAASIAFEIGKYVAQWQKISPDGFGLFDIEVLLNDGRLRGYHERYPDYFMLNFDQHLDFLTKEAFLSNKLREQIRSAVRDYESLLNLNQGFLVHKDLAFWNILGDTNRISAFIDWDDAISGDPMDDLSLLACFHPGNVVSAALDGYLTIQPPPENFISRFWLHLLRNMLFKAVIRVRGNYFDMPGDFFMNNGASNHLRQFTLERIRLACKGLTDNKEMLSL